MRAFWVAFCMNVINSHHEFEEIMIKNKIETMKECNIFPENCPGYSRDNGELSRFGRFGWFGWGHQKMRKPCQKTKNIMRVRVRKKLNT